MAGTPTSSQTRWWAAMAVTKRGLVDEGSDGADDRSWGFDGERGETKTTLADRKRQEGHCGPKTWTRAGIRRGGGGAKDAELGGDDGCVEMGTMRSESDRGMILTWQSRRLLPQEARSLEASWGS